MNQPINDVGGLMLQYASLPRWLFSYYGSLTHDLLLLSFLFFVLHQYNVTGQYWSSVWYSDRFPVPVNYAV